MIELMLAATIHFSDAYNYNWIHPHIRYEKNDWIAGVYYNSIRNPSFYIGRTFHHKSAWAELGAVTGYTKPVIPMVRVGYSVNDSLGLYAAPGYDDNGVFMLIGAEYRF